MSGLVHNLIEFSMAMFFHLMALFFLLLTIYRCFFGRREIAPFLLALLVNWTAVCILVLPYEIFSILTWRPLEKYSHDSIWMFFIALPCNQALAIIPVSVFYLTLDRIFLIYFSVHYGQRGKKWMLYGYGATLGVAIAVCQTIFILAYPREPLTGCEFFGCLLGPSLQLYLFYRAVCSAFNFSAGIVFFVLLYKYSKKLASQNAAFPVINVHQQQIMSNRQRKNNRMAILAIVSEFFLAFLPHSGPTVWEWFNGPGSSAGTGPLTQLSGSIEVFIFAVVYSQVLKSQGMAQSAANANGANVANVGQQQWVGRILPRQIQPQPPNPISSSQSQSISTRHTHQRVFSSSQQHSH